MCKLGVADFYYGAFLSALLNAPGGKPSLFDKTDSRRIFRFETNNHDECYFFAKYVNERKAKSGKGGHWIFNFSQAEVSKLQELHSQLQVFGKPSQRSSFLSQLVELMDEFYAYEVSPEMLLQQVGVSAGAMLEELLELRRIGSDTRLSLVVLIRA